jgi:excisionase family DNA binding protein
MDPLLFSVADAAPLLGIKETRLRELIAAGRIPTVQHGPRGDQLLRRADLEAYVAGLPATRRGEPARLTPGTHRPRAVTYAVTHGDHGPRRLASADGPATVKMVPYDPADEGMDHAGG